MILFDLMKKVESKQMLILVRAHKFEESILVCVCVCVCICPNPHTCITHTALYGKDVWRARRGLKQKPRRINSEPASQLQNRMYHNSGMTQTYTYLLEYDTDIRWCMQVTQRVHENMSLQI